MYLSETFRRCTVVLTARFYLDLVNETGERRQR
jgi:hypothetical protein